MNRSCLKQLTKYTRVHIKIIFDTNLQNCKSEWPLICAHIMEKSIAGRTQGPPQWSRWSWGRGPTLTLPPRSPISPNVELQMCFNMHCSVVCTISILFCTRRFVQSAFSHSVCSMLWLKVKSVKSRVEQQQLTIGRISAGRTGRRLAQI